MLLIRLSAAVREDSSAFCFPFYGHSKQKSHGKPCAYRGKCQGKRALDGL